MIEYLLRRRKITILFLIMIVMVGFISLFQLPRQEQPDIIITFAVVNTIYPGASPEKVEQMVTKKLEQKIKELQGIKTIRSTSGFGYSSIVVESKDGLDPKSVWDELRKKVKDAEAELPDGAKKPVINDDLNRTSFYTFNVTSNTREQLYDIRDTLKLWRDELRALPNVADVTIGGLPEQQIRVDVDSQKLMHYGITWTQVMMAVKSENERVPIGDLSINGRTYMLKLPDKYNVEDLNNVVVSRSRDGFPVYLKDIGQAYLSTEGDNVYIYQDDKPAVVMGVIVEKGTDVPLLQARVDKVMESLQKTLPAGVLVEPVYSQNKAIMDLYDDLFKEMIIATLAVLFICTLGLNFITALIIAFAIPISMAVGLIFLPPLNITINMMSIFALIVVLGILVDDAVVVNDNIERHLSVLGEPPFTAAVNGAREVSVSILTATMATVFSFGPLFFLQGNSGEFIKPIPVIITLTMVTSMIMSLTIIPIFRHWHESKYPRKKGEKEKPTGLLGKQFNSLTRWYASNLLPRMLKRPLRTGLIGIAIATLAYGLIAFTPVELFPMADREELVVDIRLPLGTDIEESNRLVQEVRNWIQQQEGVKSVAAISGGRADMWYGAGTEISKSVSTGQVMAKMDLDKVDMVKTIDLWQEDLKYRFPGAVVYPHGLETGPPVGDPITIHIYGEDIGKLRALAQQVKDRISKVPGAQDLKDNFGLDRHTLEFQVNKQMMDQKMVSYSDLSRTLRLVSEGINIGQYDSGKDLIGINLYMQESPENPMIVFQRLTVPNAWGEQIPLSEIATVKPSFSIQSIPHRNLARAVTITGDVKGRTVTEVMKDVESILKEIDYPEGYRWDIGGEMSEQTEIFKDMAKLSVIVFFLILIQIALQFYSLSLPLLVMSTVYMAVAGSIIGLFITRTPLGFMTMMGAIALSGIVVRNGIVLIEFIEKARKNGTELHQAVIDAGEARMRPIVLTSATAVAGLSPLALSGDPIFTPISMTIISGLVFSTMLTLMVVPSLYVVLARYKEKRQAKKTQNRHEFSEKSEEISS